MSYKKDGVLVFQQLLTDYAKKDMGAIFQTVRFLRSWLMEQPNENKGEGLYFILMTEINKVLIRFENGAGFDNYDYSALLYAVEALSEEWLNELSVRLYLDYGHPRADKLPIRKGMDFISVTEAADNVPATDGDTINILYTNGESELCTDGEKVDIYLVGEDLENATEYCVEFSKYDYDKAFLYGKLKSVSFENNDTQLLVTGASQACAGVLEKSINRPALSLAVGTQDPFYAMRAATEAKKKCRAINAVLIVAPYLFWHMDLNAEKDDIAREAMARTCAPVLGRRGSKAGEPHPPYRVKHRMPLIERAFDLQFVMDSHSRNISALSAEITYYHNRYNPRPVTGNLDYRFAHISEEEKRDAASKLAERYESLFDEAQMQRNFEEFCEFLDRMGRKKVKVYVIVPPVTAALRQACSAKARDALSEAMSAMAYENLIFKDYCGSEEFHDEDFQDYDHLNASGAEKFTGIINSLLA